MPITRRTFLYGTAAMQARKSRPNILLPADNWAWPHAGYYRDPVIKTPTYSGAKFKGAPPAN